MKRKYLRLLINVKTTFDVCILLSHFDFYNALAFLSLIIVSRFTMHPYS